MLLSCLLEALMLLTDWPLHAIVQAVLMMQFMIGVWL